MGCAAGDDSWDEENVGESQTEVINGTHTLESPATVALLGWGQVFCSGTLIRPDVVMTAAHCVPPHINDFGITQYSQIDIFFGANVYNDSGTSLDVIDGWTHPGWWSEAVADDIALLRLAAPAPVAHVPFAEDPMSNTTHVGTEVRFVGFGQTNASQPSSVGLKHEGIGLIEDVYLNVFIAEDAPSSICSGDSGGSAMIMENGNDVVAGVNSRGDCVTGSIETKVQSYVEEIYAFMGQAPGDARCGQDGQCASQCGRVDLDCPCAGDGYCVAECTDPLSDPDCKVPCSADTVCDAGCDATPDPDCDYSETTDGWNSAGTKRGEIDGEPLQTGCTTAPTNKDMPLWWAFAFIGLGLASRRSRRSA